MTKWTEEKILEEALKYETRASFSKGNDSAYRAAIKKNILEKVASHMPTDCKKNNIPHNFKWTLEKLQEEALKYTTRGQFQKNSSAYKAAFKRNLLDEICQHMEEAANIPYSLNEIKETASKYATRGEFQKQSNAAYQAAIKQNVLDVVCDHMTASLTAKYSEEELKQEALKYKTRGEFAKNSPGAYTVAHKRSIINNISDHMISNLTYWSEILLQEEALKHKTRKEFNQNSNAYNVARERGLLDEICQHMERSSNTSLPEQNLFDIIKQKYPKAQKLKIRKVKIQNKSHIYGFDIDIYVPELRKGIEFDGKYWHSPKGLAKGRPNWPSEDIENYHQIKDDYFLSKGIRVLHINERDWNEHKENCIKECLTFLEQK